MRFRFFRAFKPKAAVTPQDPASILAADEARVAPAADTVLLFNSSLPHAVTQSRAAERWALTMWVHGTVHGSEYVN